MPTQRKCMVCNFVQLSQKSGHTVRNREFVPRTPGDGFMINVIVADDVKLFRLGMTDILEVPGDVRILGQPQSAEQLLSALSASRPHVLLLSSSFIEVFDKIQPLLKRDRTALVVLAEENDRIAYKRWLRARAVVHRTMEGTVIVQVMRRVARGELFIQDRSSD